MAMEVDPVCGMRIDSEGAANIVGLRMTMVRRHDECVDLTELSWSPC